MKKTVFLLLLSFLFIFGIFGVGLKVDSKIAAPSITPESYYGGKKIPGGVQYTITNNEPGSSVYYGIIDEHSYKSAEYLWTQIGKQWDSDLLRNKNTFTNGSVNVDVKIAGDVFIYAVSVVDKKSSSFSVQRIELDRASLSEYDIRITNGTISNTGTGSYRELYASLDPNMEDARLIYDGALPSEFLGKPVFFQTRNTKGWADSDIVMIQVEGRKIDKPYIQWSYGLRGCSVEITKPSVYVGTGGVGRGGQYAPEEDVYVYFTIDGSDPDPEKSEKYVGPFTVSEEGTFTVKAIAVHKEAVSMVASSSSFTLRKLSKPTVRVSGLDVSIQTNDGSVYMGYSKDGITIQSNYYVVEEKDIGKTLFFQVVRNGYAPSDVVEISVDSLLEFQDKYSNDKSRQFGYWRVEAELNRRGVPTGNYTLVGRWPCGAIRHIIAVAQLDEEAEFEALVFCSPSGTQSTSQVQFAFDTSSSVLFEVDGISYYVPYDVYQINPYTYRATYKIVATKENAADVIDLLNSGKDFSTVAVLQEELNGMDALTGMAVAGQYYNSEAAFDAYLDNIELNDFQFIFSTEGLSEALAYYKSEKGIK